MRVFDLQWIEGPLHPSDASRKCLTSLLQLELRSKTAIAIVISYRQHVGVQVGLWISVCGILPCLHAGQRHGESHHRLRRAIGSGAGQVCIECSYDLAANFLTNQEGLTRDDIAIVVAPGLDLHLD